MGTRRGLGSVRGGGDFGTAGGARTHGFAPTRPENATSARGSHTPRRHRHQPLHHHLARPRRRRTVHQEQPWHPSHNRRAPHVCVRAATLWCGGALAGACIVREDQRIQSYGFARSLTANGVDLLLTVGSGLTLTGSFGGAGASLTQGLGPVSSFAVTRGIPVIWDLVQLGVGEAPGHDPVFFNGSTINP